MLAVSRIKYDTLDIYQTFKEEYEYLLLFVSSFLYDLKGSSKSSKYISSFEHAMSTHYLLYKSFPKLKFVDFSR